MSGPDDKTPSGGDGGLGAHMLRFAGVVVLVVAGLLLLRYLGLRG
jgi:hypothetical protein